MAVPQALEQVDPTKSLSYKYEAIIDFMLSHPHMKRGEIAVRLGFTPAYFSVLTNSDGFRARYAHRRAAMEEELKTRHVARLHQIAELAADRVVDALTPREGEEPCDPRFANEVHSRVLGSLGFGSNSPSGGGGGANVNLQVNNYNRDDVPPERLAAARERLTQVSRQPAQGQTYDGRSEEPKALPEPVSKG